MKKCLNEPWTRQRALRALLGFLLGFTLSYTAEGAFETAAAARAPEAASLLELLPRASRSPRLVEILF